MTNATKTALFLPLVACMALFTSCATAPAGPDSTAVGGLGASGESATAPGSPEGVGGPSGSAQVPGAPPPPVDTPAPSKGLVLLGPAAPPDVTETDKLERTGLGALESVTVKLSHADVALATGADYRRGLLSIEKLEGDPSCKVRVRVTSGVLELTEPLPPSGGKLKMTGGKARSVVPAASACRYAITIGLKEAVAAAVDVTKGSVTVESWSEELKINLAWGDIDVGSVGPLSVTCERCAFSGEGVDGDLHYSLEAGNVGVAGLTGSVDGKTLGDTVLKWSRMRPDATVRVVSHAGDVILFFPETSPLAVDLHAPHGDVSSRFESSGRGLPVSVTAELGNVQVYRIGKSGQPSQVRHAKRKR